MTGTRVLVALTLALLAMPVAAPAPTHAAPRDADDAEAVQERLEARVMCPTCETTLDRSSSPAAEQMRQIIVERAEAGATEEEIVDELLLEYGGDEAILAVPPASGSGWLAWIVPAAFAAGALGGAWLALRRMRRRRRDVTR